MFTVEAPVVAQDEGLPGVKLEIVSIRRLTEQEALDRSPDFIGPNILVRLRLTVARPGVSFYSWKASRVPAGYKVQRSGREIVWLYGVAGMEMKASSPGLSAVLFGLVGEWVPLAADSSVEWEDMDSTEFSGSKHAFSVFLRARGGEPREVISPFYDVPMK
jgi:hypothetical protein